MILQKVRRLLGREKGPKQKETEYEEIVVTMGELQEGDLVYGTDGRWHEINLLPIHVPHRMYRLEFENGSVECSGDHLWTLYNGSTLPETLPTEHIAQNNYIGARFGTIGGPKLISIQETEPTESRCIEVDNNDHLFEILTDEGNPVFTHNCQFRMVCGRLGRVASMMALDSTLATTIDGERKGAGIVSSNGIVEHIQYYYADQDWIEDWYAKRGLTPTGHQPNEEEEAEIFDDFEGTEEIAPNREVVDIEFAGVHGQVDKTPDQKFEEI